MKVILILLIATFSTLGQQPNAAIITPEDFRPIFDAGFRVTQELGKQGLRYTETRSDGVLSVENDRRGVVRASYSISGIVQSECIVNGDRIYERTGQGPWIIRTQAEFKAEQTARSEVLAKARAEKDHETYSRVFAETRKRIFVQAGCQTDSGLTFRAFRIDSLMLSFASPGVDDKVITEVGPSEHKGKAVRLYRFTAYYDPELASNGRSNGDRKYRIGVEYWFEKKTGAVVKIRTVRNWSSDAKPHQEIVVRDWELDPSFGINVPILGG